MADRAPTRAERAQWDGFLKRFDRLGRAIYQNSARALNLEILRKHAFAYNVDVPAAPAQHAQKLQAIGWEWKRLRKAIGYVESYDLGVQFTASKDMNIVAPPHYTADQIANLNLSGWFIPIALGIVIVAGIIARLVELETKNNELTASYDAMIKASEAAICKDPQSAVCKTWQVEKDDNDYTKNKSLIDEIQSSFADVGQTVKTGLGWGVAIAIPLIVFLVLRK